MDQFPRLRETAFIVRNRGLCNRMNVDYSIDFNNSRTHYEKATIWS